MSAVMRSRKDSVVSGSIAEPRRAKFSESRPSQARLYRAGTSRRLVRSPDAPNTSITHGCAGASVSGASAPDVLRTWASSSMGGRGVMLVGGWRRAETHDARADARRADHADGTGRRRRGGAARDDHAVAAARRFADAIRARARSAAAARAGGTTGAAGAGSAGAAGAGSARAAARLAGVAAAARAAAGAHAAAGGTAAGSAAAGGTAAGSAAAGGTAAGSAAAGGTAAGSAAAGGAAAGGTAARAGPGVATRADHPSVANGEGIAPTLWRRCRHGDRTERQAKSLTKGKPHDESQRAGGYAPCRGQSARLGWSALVGVAG